MIRVVLFSFAFFNGSSLICFLQFCCYLQIEKKNLQDLNGVYVFNVPERECIDRPTARLIKEFNLIEGRCRITNFLLSCSNTLFFLDLEFRIPFLEITLVRKTLHVRIKI